MSFKTPVLWAMLDPNGHLRHSVYADLAAQARVYELNRMGIDQAVFQHYKMGPILFREESIYLREVKMNDVLTTTVKLSKARKDGSRFSFMHEVFRSDGVNAAIINIDGAWLDLEKRKLMIPPPEFQEKMLLVKRTEDYEETAG